MEVSNTFLDEKGQWRGVVEVCRINQRKTIHVMEALYDS